MIITFAVQYLSWSWTVQIISLYSSDLYLYILCTQVAIDTYLFAPSATTPIPPTNHHPQPHPKYDDKKGQFYFLDSVRRYRKAVCLASFLLRHARVFLAESQDPDTWILRVAVFPYHHLTQFAACPSYVILQALWLPTEQCSYGTRYIFSSLRFVPTCSYCPPTAHFVVFHGFKINVQFFV